MVFFLNLGYALDICKQTYEKFFLSDDLNTEEAEPCLSEFLTSFDSKSLVKDKTCFKNTENPPRCIDLFITYGIGSFQKTAAVASGLSDS